MEAAFPTFIPPQLAWPAEERMSGESPLPPPFWITSQAVPRTGGKPAVGAISPPSPTLASLPAEEGSCLGDHPGCQLWGSLQWGFILPA